MQIRSLELDSQLLPHSRPVPAGVHPPDRDLPTVWCAYTCDQLDQRGLAGTIWAEEADDLPCGHGQRYIVHGIGGAIGLGHLLRR